MDFFLLLFFIVLLLFGGLVGCFINLVPGPLIAYLGMLLLHITGLVKFTSDMLIVWGVLVAASMLINYLIVPRIVRYVTHFSFAGRLGTIIGGVLAVTYMVLTGNISTAIIIALVVPFVLALVFEIVGTGSFWGGIRGGLGAYIVYLITTAVKLTVVVMMIMGFLSRVHFVNPLL